MIKSKKISNGSSFLNALVETQCEAYYLSLNHETSASFNLFLRNNEYEFRNDKTMVNFFFQKQNKIIKGLLKQASFSLSRKYLVDLKKVYSNYSLE